MGVFEIILTGVALSMDAAAISMTNSMLHRDKLPRLFEMAFWFGLFQGLMPLFGYALGAVFHDVVSCMGGFLAAAIFIVLGAKMIKDSLSPEGAAGARDLSRHILLLQAFATSIDAFAVGVGISAAGGSAVLAAPIIAATTFIISLAAAAVGRVFGDVLGGKAELLGGVILIFLGVKALF